MSARLLLPAPLLAAPLLAALALSCADKAGVDGEDGDSPATDGADGSTDGADGSTDGTDGTEPWGEQPAFTSPVEAEDLDPADDVVRVQLTAAPATHTITDWRTGEALTVEGYAYSGALPGPTIRANVGDTVLIELTNGLDTPTTIHWHGLDVPYEMDGVMWTYAPVMPGETFTYTFTVEQVGTFWYHPHFDTERQVDLGLYGAFVVEDPAEPAADHDLVAVVDDWGEVAHTDADPDVVHGAHGELGNLAVNGLVRPRIDVAGGETVRLRVLNVTNHGYLDLELPELRRLAGGQGLLPAPDLAAHHVVPPGDRAELEIRPGDRDLTLLDRPYSLNGGAGQGEPVGLLDVSVSAPASAADPLPFVWEEVAPTADPGRTDVLYVFQGEAHTDTWRINGERFPDVTVEALDLDQHAIIEVRNLSATEHPFHLHGMRFEVLSRDGVAPERRWLDDTINVGLHEAVRLRIVADNEGFWMAHCHILPHADGGMMTVLQVGEPPEE